MAEIIARQDRKREIIDSIQKGGSKNVSLFSKEIKRFKKEYPSLSFEVQHLDPDHPGCHIVKVSFL